MSLLFQERAVLAGPYGTRIKERYGNGRDVTPEGFANFLAQGSDGPMGQIAKADLAAGANVFQTPTFRVVDGDTYRKSIALLTGIIGERDDCHIAIDFGPMEDCYSPSLAPGETDAKKYHANSLATAQEHTSGLPKRFTWFETINHQAEALGIAKTSLIEQEVPFALNFVVDDQGRLLDGTEIERLAEEILKIRNDIRIGVNCCSTQGAMTAQRLMQERLGRGLDIVYPNASDSCGADLDACHGVHGCDIETLATRINQLGAWISGVCCGGNEYHIAALKKQISS